MKISETEAEILPFKPSRYCNSIQIWSIFEPSLLPKYCSESQKELRIQISMKSVDQLMIFGHFDLTESAHMVGFQDPKTRSVSQVTGSYGLQNDSEGVSQHQRARGNRKNG